MPAGQIETFGEIAIEWKKAERESDKRAVWRTLARGGWFRACRDAAQRGDRATLEVWLDESDSTKQDIVQFHGAEAAQMVRAHLLCSFAACLAREVVPLELMKSTWEAAASQPDAIGFCRDLTQELLGEPLRKPERDLSLTVLLVDTARNEGIVATLTLELVPEGSGGFYPVPELAFGRDPDFRRAEAEARACIEGINLWRKAQDVRWRLQRRDGKPIANLSGPSLGAAFALGIAQLFAEE